MTSEGIVIVGTGMIAFCVAMFGLIGLPNVVSPQEAGESSSSSVNYHEGQQNTIQHQDMQDVVQGQQWGLSE